MADWVDIKALDDLPDPEEITQGDESIAYAQGRRLLEPQGAHEEIGDTERYDSVDTREWLGKRPTQAEIETMEAEVVQVLSSDERVRAVDASVNVLGSRIEIEESHRTEEGETTLNLSVDDVTASLLIGD